MKLLLKPTLLLAGAASIISLLALQRPGEHEKKDPQPLTAKPAGKSDKKIQAAILLDVSNSMDGLIGQAKSQLWNMVSVMGKVRCEGLTPEIEIALYEYGRSSNDAGAGYVKQISPFTTDLDKLSQELFNLTTNGGDEYCGQVIYTSLKDLNWGTDPGDYKVIFIAGNEDFLQGNLQYTKACNEAKQKGVIVNTIYCGDKMQGIREHWNLNAECGSGSFTNINQNEKIEEIPTPYDSVILALNTKLNGTYLSYGYDGEVSYANQARVDQLNMAANKTEAVNRVAVKGRKDLYKNSHWDMVDAASDDKSFVQKVDMKALPDSLQKRSRKELQELIDKKSAERTAIQNQILTANARREAYIAEQKKKSTTGSQGPTLKSEIENIIRKQAVRFKMEIK